VDAKTRRVGAVQKKIVITSTFHSPPNMFKFPSSRVLVHTFYQDIIAVVKGVAVQEVNVYLCKGCRKSVISFAETESLMDAFATKVLLASAKKGGEHNLYYVEIASHACFNVPFEVVVSSSSASTKEVCTSTATKQSQFSMCGLW
jgi:hypothetical protein